MHVCMYGCVYVSLNDFVRFIYTYMAESQKYFIHTHTHTYIATHTNTYKYKVCVRLIYIYI